MEIKENLNEIYSKMNIFLEKLENGERPVELIPPGGFSIIEIDDMPYIRGFLQPYTRVIDYIYFDREDYEKLQCICYAYYKLKNHGWSDLEKRLETRARYGSLQIRYHEIEDTSLPTLSEDDFNKFHYVYNYTIDCRGRYYFDNWKLLSDAITSAASYDEYFAMVNCIKVALLNRSYGLLEAFDSEEARQDVAELKLRKENEAINYNPIEVLNNHPEYAYLYDKKHILEVLKNVAGTISTSRLTSDTDIIDEIDKLNILSEEYLKRERVKIDTKSPNL